MEEKNKNLDESEPKGISKGAGIACGLTLGFILESMIFGIAIYGSAILILIFVLFYIALIFLSYLKGIGSIGLGLILSFCITVLIFGGCLVGFAW